jgi:hypothetical protein
MTGRRLGRGWPAGGFFGRNPLRCRGLLTDYSQNDTLFPVLRILEESLIITKT